MFREFNRTEYEAVDAWTEAAIVDMLIGRMRVPDKFLYDINDGFNTVMVERLGRDKAGSESYFKLNGEGWALSFTERGGGTQEDPLTFHDIVLHGDDAFGRAVLMRQLATDVAA
jgi:hypothetical protein